MNEFELIRKYQCDDCGAVIMCACDEKVGRAHFPHQLDRGTEYETQQRVRVTAGFQPEVCRECRGLPIVAHPTGEIYGRKSKIRRYYWRELAFRVEERLAEWSASQNGAALASGEKVEARKRIEQEVLNELKLLHATSPKYTFMEESPGQILRKYQVEVIDLKGTYAINPSDKSVALVDGVESCGVEEFASRHFRKQRYETLFLESVPFHVLFGTFMWLVIQDVEDPLVRIVSFGDRNAYENRGPPKLISMLHPRDFGRAGYGKRRAKEIDAHILSIKADTGEIKWLFDYWLGPSENLRQYLWAHRERDIQRARQLLDILPAEAIIKILRYLVEYYWGRYLGWPDLLVRRGAELFFVEVKSSGDRLDENQKRWIAGNYHYLNFPFKLVKVHKAAAVPI